MDRSLEKIDIDSQKGIELFFETVKKVFDLDQELLDDICNRDFLWSPTTPENDQYTSTNMWPNYYQWITFETREREPILSVLSYLMDRTEPYYHDIYDYPGYERPHEAIKNHFIKVARKYKTAENYFKQISKRLWKPDTWLQQTKERYLIKLKKLISELDIHEISQNGN